MRYLGAVKSLKQAKKDASRLSRQAKKAIVIEKAKVMSRNGKWGIGYRVWADMNTRKAKVLTYEEWKQKKKRRRK